MSRRAAEHRARLALLAGQASFQPQSQQQTDKKRRKQRTQTKSKNVKKKEDDGEEDNFFPPISSQAKLSSDTASHTVEGIGHFLTRASARGYNQQYSVRGTKVDRQLNKMGYMSKRQREKGQTAVPIVSQAIKKKTIKPKFVKSIVPETVMETRRKKMKKVMLNMLLQARRKGWLQWMEWQDMHTIRFGKNATLSKVNEKNEKVLVLNKKNLTHHDLPGGGLKSGDIVLFTCIEAPIEGDLRPIHVIEPNYASKRNRTLLLVGIIDGGKAAKANQQRRGHGNEAMIPITFWTRDPNEPLDVYESSIHERFIRKSKTYSSSFLLENVVVKDDLEFPDQIVKRPKGWTPGCDENALEIRNNSNANLIREDDEDDVLSDDSDEWVSAYRKSKWIFTTVLVPDSNVYQREKWKWNTMNTGISCIDIIQKRYSFNKYKKQILKQRRSDSRDGAATTIQQYVRAYQGRILARALYTRAVRRDRREMRSKRRVARMARYELKQRLKKINYKKYGITIDGKKFHRTLASMSKDWHFKQVSASILLPFVHMTRLDFLYHSFHVWNDYSKKFIQSLNSKNRLIEESKKLSGKEMAEIFEKKNNLSNTTVASKWDDTPEHPPWHPAVNIRMPTLPTSASIGAVGTKNGTLNILDIERWSYWKERMAGPLDNSHWLLRGPDGKSGPSVYANICIGGYPSGFAKSNRGKTLNNNSLVSLLSAGIDTFICLMTKHELTEHEKSLGLGIKKSPRSSNETSPRSPKGSINRFSNRSSNQSSSASLSKNKNKRKRKKPMIMTEAKKEEIERNEKFEKERLISIQRLGPNPPYYKLHLVEHHARMKKSMAVGMIATKKRYEKALIAANKAATYAAAQRAVMQAKMNDALAAARGAKRQFDVLTKQVRFVDYELNNTNIIPVTKIEKENFLQLIYDIERRLRRKERIYIFSKQGHGRAGTLAACLLGHLYGLTSLESLEIVQRSHNARIDMELTKNEVIGTSTVKWRDDKFFLLADKEKDIPKTSRIAKYYSTGPPRTRVACPRHAIQRQFVKEFLIPVQQISNPVDLRGENGQVTQYSLTREEVFAESQTWKPNKFKIAREEKNHQLALSMGIGANDEDDEKDQGKKQ